MDNPIFAVNLFFFRVAPMYRPPENWNCLFKAFYYLWRVFYISTLLITVVLNTLDIAKKGAGDIPAIAMNIMYIELYFSVLIRLPAIICQQKTIDGLATRFVTELTHESQIAIRPKNINSTKRNCRNFVIFWMVYVITAAWLGSAASLVRNERTFEVPIWVWYDLESSLYYYLTLLMETFSVTLMLTSFGNFDMLNCTFMGLTIGIINVLSADVGDIINAALVNHGCEEHEINVYLTYDENMISRDRKINDIIKRDSFKEEILKNLLICVKRHQTLLKFVEDFHNFISPHLLIVAGFNFTYMIFMLFIFVTTDNSSQYPLIFQYLIGYLMQIFVPTYLGDKLSQTFEKLEKSLYGLPWYMCDKGFNINFEIVQQRMVQPGGITAGKILPMNLETFFEFVKKAFSFFTVLRQMNNP